jgi:molybdate transport system substrate-binding protein
MVSSNGYQDSITRSSISLEGVPAILKKGPLALLVVILMVASWGAGFIASNSSGSVTSHKIRVYFGAAAEVPEQEIVALFENRTGIKVEYTISGSGTLLSTIQMGKVGDLYAPGSPDFMQMALNQGVMVNDTVKILAYVVPEIIVQKGNPKNITSLDDLARPGIRVGIANPESVCVGLYAVEILNRSGLWENVRPNIVVYAKSCSDAASLVVTRSVDAIIGWNVFYNWTPDKVDIVYLKPEQIPRIAYIPIGITKYSDDPASAQKLIDFMLSQESQAIFAKYGYFATLNDAKKLAPYASADSLIGVP